MRWGGENSVIGINWCRSESDCRVLPADGCLSLLASALITASLNSHKYDTNRSCNVFSDVKAFRKQTARPVKLWTETLVEKEQLGESRDIIKIYSCSFLQWDSRWFSSPIQWVLRSLWGKTCLGVKLITHLPLLPTVRMCGAIPLLLLYAFKLCTGTSLLCGWSCIELGSS